MRKKSEQTVYLTVGIILGIVLLISGKVVIRNIVSILGLFEPFWIGIAIAMILNRAYHFLRREITQRTKLSKKTASYLAIGIEYLVILIGIAALVGIIIPQLSKSVHMFSENIEGYMQNLQQELNALTALVGIKSIDMSNIEQLVLSAIGTMTKTSGKLVSTVVSATGTIVHAVAVTLISVVFSVYLLAGQERILNQLGRLVRAYLPKPAAEYLIELRKIIVQTFENYVIGQGIEAMILGSLCFIGMLILKLDYAGMVSIVVAVTAVIPVLGAYIGGAVAVVLLMMISPVKAGIFLIFFVILQQIENKLIYPRIVGGRIGLAGIWVLLAITVGAKLGGIAGTFLGVPVASVIYTLLKNGVRKREQKQLSNTQREF